MNNKKHIDRLFQEKLKGFESTPSPSVWENISNELHADKKRRRIIPVWWKIAGVAASLVLLFSIGNLLFNNDINSNPVEKVVSSPTIDETIQDKTDQNKTNRLDEIDDSNTDVANQGLEPDGNSKSSKTLNNSVQNNTDKNFIVVSQKESSDTPKNVGNKTHSAIAQTLLDLDNLDGKEKIIDDKQINSNIKELNNIEKTKNTDVVIQDSKKKIFEAVSENKVEEDGKLSLTDALVSVNENARSEKNIEKNNKWSVSPSIAPVYFNTLGSGSSIHEQFNNNSKTGDINMSYGISANYAINKKISVRTGVHKVNLGYSTNDVVVYENLQTTSSRNSIKNISLNQNGQNLSLISTQGFNFAQVPSIISNHINASINQELGFIEVPLELQYNISNKKLRLNLIGGVSALFLSNNNVYSVQEGKSTLLGKATNVNNTSYSANLGLGLDYKILKKVNLNLEPVFKYQLNTFNNTSGNFKPYFIGIYTGFSFKF